MPGQDLDNLLRIYETFTTLYSNISDIEQIDLSLKTNNKELRDAIL